MRRWVAAALAVTVLMGSSYDTAPFEFVRGCLNICGFVVDDRGHLASKQPSGIMPSSPMSVHDSRYQVKFPHFVIGASSPISHECKLRNIEIKQAVAGEHYKWTSLQPFCWTGNYDLHFSINIDAFAPNRYEEKERVQGGRIPVVLNDRVRSDAQNYLFVHYGADGNPLDFNAFYGDPRSILLAADFVRLNGVVEGKSSLAKVPSNVDNANQSGNEGEDGSQQRSQGPLRSILLCLQIIIGLYGSYLGARGLRETRKPIKEASFRHDGPAGFYALLSSFCLVGGFMLALAGVFILLA